MIFGLDAEISQPTQTMLSLIFLWPFLIGWRRYFQGLLIHEGQSRKIGTASLGRISAVVFFLGVGFQQSWRGEVVAALALIGGIFIESFLVTVFAFRSQDAVRSLLVPREKITLDLKSICKFYWPLANSSLIVWGGRALLIAIIARSAEASVDLASWTAGWGLILVVANATRMVQQVTIRRRNMIPDSQLLIFGCSVGLTCSLILAFMSFSDWGRVFLDFFLGQDESLRERVQPIMAICFVVPLGVAIQNILQGFLIGESKTKLINFATWCGVSSLLMSAVAFTSWGSSGAIAAAGSMVLSFFVELTILAVALQSHRATSILPSLDLALSKKTGILNVKKEVNPS